jgi:small-conductance mechanosensitive channel
MPAPRRAAAILACIAATALGVAARAQPAPDAAAPPVTAQPKPPPAKPPPAKPTAAPAATAAASATASAAPSGAPDAAAPSASASAPAAEPDPSRVFGPPRPPPPEPLPPEETWPEAEDPAPPAPGSSAAPTPAPAGSAAPVRLHDVTVFGVQVARAGQSAEQRAAAASAVLRKAMDEGASTEVRVEERGDAAVVFLGTKPVIELGNEDATAAGAPSLKVHAAAVANQLREAIRAEQSKSATLMTILSLALVIFSGMVAIFLVRRAGDMTDRARGWIADNPERIPAIRLRSIEVIRPASLRAALTIGLSASKALVQIGVAYGWLLLTLSLFDATRGYAERLTGFVFGPLYGMVARIVGSLPLLVVAAIATVALVVLVRFVGLFFDSVARGETVLEWLPADLAAPTSLLARAAVVLLFFVLAAPLVSGSDDGALTRAGTVALVALGLAATPLLSCAAVGVTVVYGRRLRIGDWADVGGRSGLVRAITLLEVWLEDEQGGEVRVPHLLGLVHPTRVRGRRPMVAVEIVLAPSTAAQDRVKEVLVAAAAGLGERARAEVAGLDADGARWRVAVQAEGAEARGLLYTAVARAIDAAEVPLGRSHARASSPP